MASGISIPISSDGRAFAQGVKSGVLEPLEDTVESLDKVDSAAEDTGRELERSFDRAQDASKDFERQNKKLSDTIRDESRKSSKAIRDIGDEGFDKSGDAVKGFKDEALSNFSEVASSFDGTMTGVVDGVTGTLGGLATAISGPVGLALGGLGLIAGAVSASWAANAEQIAEDWQAMYDDMVESGQNFLSQDLINQKIQDIAADQGKVNEALSQAKSVGEDYLTVIRAQAGDMDALAAVYTSAREALDEQNAAQERYIEKNGEESAAIASKQGELEILIGKYGDMIGSQDNAATAAGIARRAMEESAAANNATADSLDRVRDSSNGIPDGKTIKVYADTSEWDAEVERIRRTTFSITGDINWQHRGRTLP